MGTFEASVQMTSKKVSPAARETHSSLLIALVFAVGLFFLMAFGLQILLPNWRWENAHLYYLMDGFGGLASILLGVILAIVIQLRRENPFLAVAAISCVVSGAAGLFGSLSNSAQVTVWLKCESYVLGSIVLCGIWLPEDFLRRHFPLRNSLYFSLIISTAVYFWTFLYAKQFLHPAVDASALSFEVQYLIGFSGILYFASLPRILKTIPAEERLTISLIVVCLSLGAVMFPFIKRWEAAWWLVQTIRRAPYVFGIWYIARTFLNNQKNLIESEARLNALFQKAPVGIGLIDNKEYRYMKANPALCNLIGVKEEDLVRKSLRSVIHPDDLDASFDARNSLMLGATSEICATRRYLTNDGQVRWVKIHAALIPLGEKSSQEFRIVEDVTNEKVANEKVSTLVNEFTRANSELERFASVASHDLKSPLNTVSSYVQLIARHLSVSADPELRQFMQFAIEGCGRMRNLIDDLLSYASVSKSAHQFQMVDCNVVLDEVTRNLEIEIKESCAKIESPRLPTILGDKIQLSQLFQNLIGNAIKYHGEKSPVVHIEVEEKDEDWLFSVTDNGIGFDMEYAERVFDEFQRLNSQAEYSGTGLGLPICKSIVKRHGGTIWAKSAPGEGSSFFFTLRKPALSTEGTQAIQMDREYTGPFPRYSGAISAVTGGSPEDMNKMPATLHPETEGQIYDGSSLDSGQTSHLGK